MPRKKVVRGEQETWEAARRDAWLRELLTDSSGDEFEGGCTRFEESSRWIAEMGERAMEADPVLPKDTSDEDFVKGVLATLDMLDERAERMGEKLEEIERRVMRLGEGKEAVHVKKRLRREVSSDLWRSERLRSRQTGGGQLGIAMLMLSVFSVLSGQGKAQEPYSGHHETMIEMMRNMAMGLEMAESMARGVEVTKVRATILQGWDWYGPTPRTTSAGPRQPGPPEAARAEALREVPNCTAVADKAGELNAREGIAFGLQIMGVFTLCGLLATLGWGGMTGLIMVISKVWPVEEAREHKDVSTSTGSLDRQSQAQLLKPAVISPREERARLEWPRRTVSATRRVHWMNGPTLATTYGRKHGECELEMSTRGRPSGGSVTDTRDRGQPACHEDLKK
jgi:hypothetical protein